ncbi:MAG: hypothetical protein PHT07_01210 [Paludibacter sp.]|nr:hypothetical protein [Paludibacter sp.]
MYKGFEIKISKEDFPNYRLNLKNNYYTIGNKLYTQDKNVIQNEITKFKLPNGAIDGTAMQANWFPKIHANVFISHSHKDKEFAISLAGWLKIKFGLTAFIDSCVWGFADDLLKLIDNEYCSIRENNKIVSYNYKDRNYSTSHVHMMLSNALTSMIDNCECIFFLNTPNSITPYDVVSTKTQSPWIYTEIAMTSLIRKKDVSEYRPVIIVESFSITERKKELNLEYIINTDHLIKLRKRDLQWWEDNWPYDDYHSPDFTKFALDKLYELISNK